VEQFQRASEDKVRIRSSQAGDWNFRQVKAQDDSRCFGVFYVSDVLAVGDESKFPWTCFLNTGNSMDLYVVFCSHLASELAGDFGEPHNLPGNLGQQVSPHEGVDLTPAHLCTCRGNSYKSMYWRIVRLW